MKQAHFTKIASPAILKANPVLEQQAHPLELVFASKDKLQKKNVDLPGVWAVGPAGGDLQLLNGLIPGPNVYQRIGRKVSMTSLETNGMWFLADDTAGPVKTRLVIVYDKQSKGVAPTWQNIFKSETNTGASSTNVFAQINQDNRDRFEVLQDTRQRLGWTGTNATGSFALGEPSCNVDTFIDLQGRDVIFNSGSTGTITDIQTGALYVFFITNQANLTGASFQGTFTLYYTDA